MKFSIITINYNNREGLQKTINSVVSQTFKDYEWIIIDGGSTDGSRELIEQYKEHLSYWCSEPDKGIYNAMNKGIRHAKGEYLNFMNSGDTFYDNEVLEKVFKEERKADILYGDCMQIYQDHVRLFSFPHNCSLYDLYKCNICQQTIFVKSSLLLKEGFDESFYILSDWARWIKAALNGATFKYLALIICKYDMFGISSMNSDKAEGDFKRIISLYPDTIFSVLNQLSDYENDVSVQRIKFLMKKSKISHYITRVFLKFMEMIFLRNNKYKDNLVWNENSR